MDIVKTIAVIFIILVIIILIFPILSKPQLKTERHIEVPKPSPTQLDQRTEEDKKTSKSLDTYFKPISNCLGVDYPVKNIGECPYSKPQKRDLPIANIPMCFLEKNENMYLDNLK